ncbi:PREDICTED: microtubule-binding protein TANGLED-like [Brassica oleracea var. oleracea]|uniref:Microtubule-binding protein TANGLED n=1 Tax=Brassica oleracea var. oleracea TaxID=109376 RepID=A0A0D3AFI8_BRAOL|nr:PREDICTED: microtubule-binding protein TANGLED-like [Brassica oleracea var. oleracea]
MVARTPQMQRRVAMVVPPLNTELLKETINKVDKCMERLQELQYTIAGGTKVVSGVNLSPRSTRIYLKTSLRCKQETLRIKNATNKKSPLGKFPASSPGDWRKMSLPAMLLGETVNEILQASHVTRDIVDALAPKKSRKSTMPEEDGCPKTPETQQKSLEPKPKTVNSNIKARRKKEKQNKRSEPTSPASIHKARSRIVFKIVSPQTKAEKKAQNGENSFRHAANRVSPKHKPWVKKAVLFPNPLFISGSSTQQAKFSRTMSPVIARSKNSKETPRKFQVKIKSPPKVSVSPNRSGSNLGRKSPRGSPTRSVTLGKSPKLSTAAKLRRSFTPTRNGSDVARKSSISPKRVTLQAFISPSRNGGNVGKKSPKPWISPTRVGKKTSTAAKLRRSFSPSRLAMRLVSPLKSRKSVGKCDDHDEMGMMVSGLKQRPVIVPKRFSMGRI